MIGSSNPNLGQSTIQSGFKWDTSKCGHGIEITGGGFGVFLKEQAYVFRTVLADTPMTSGIYYWEIIADNRT